MDRNPYAPPAAVVSDPVPAPLPERPYAVKRGVLLLWISFGLGVLQGGWDIYTGPKQALGLIVGLVLALPIFGLVGLLLYKISTQRHWARVTYLILAICGYLLTIYIHVFSTGNEPTDVIEILLNTSSTV